MKVFNFASPKLTHGAVRLVELLHGQTSEHIILFTVYVMTLSMFNIGTVNIAISSLVFAGKAPVSHAVVIDLGITLAKLQINAPTTINITQDTVRSKPQKTERQHECFLQNLQRQAVPHTPRRIASIDAASTAPATPILNKLAAPVKFVPKSAFTTDFFV